LTCISNTLALVPCSCHNMQYDSTVDSRYYDYRYKEILLITIPNLYPNHSQTIEIPTGYIDSLVIVIHFPYSIRIVMTRVYCTLNKIENSMICFMYVLMRNNCWPMKTYLFQKTECKQDNTLYLVHLKHNSFALHTI